MMCNKEEIAECSNRKSASRNLQFPSLLEILQQTPHSPIERDETPLVKSPQRRDSSLS